MVFKPKYPQEVKDYIAQSQLNGKALCVEVKDKFGFEIPVNSVYNMKRFAQGYRYKRKHSIPTSWMLKPVGSERKDKDGYIRVRVGDGERLKHHIVWEKDHEPLKKNEVIMFKDGDKTNCDVENLIKVERKYLACISSIIGKERGDGLLETAIAAAKLRVEARNKKIFVKRNQPNCQPRKKNYDEIISLYEGGMLPSGIAKKLNLHISGVRWSLRKYRAVHNLENPY